VKKEEKRGNSDNSREGGGNIGGGGEEIQNDELKMYEKGSGNQCVKEVRI
jgi:hypothetical protein